MMDTLIIMKLIGPAIALPNGYHTHYVELNRK